MQFFRKTLSRHTSARCSFFRQTRKTARDPREDPRTQDPKEDPITMDPKEDPKENPMDEGPITEDHIIHKKILAKFAKLAPQIKKVTTLKN